MNISFMGKFAEIYIFAVFLAVYLGLSFYRSNRKLSGKLDLKSRFLWIFTPAGLTRVVALDTIITGLIAIPGGIWQRMGDKVLSISAKFYMELPASASGNSATIVSASGDHAYVLATGVTPTVRAFLSFEYGMNMVLVVTIAWVVYRFATAADMGQGFLDTMPKSLKAVALVLLVTQTASQYFGSRADSLASHELFGANLSSESVPHAISGMNLPMWQLFVAAGIWVFAGLLEKGVLLQRETAGLV